MDLNPVQRRRIVVFANILALFGPLSVDLFLPTLPSVAQTFQAPVSHVQLTVTGFILAMALSMVVAGSVTDRFGRIFVVRWGLGIYAVSCVLCMLAWSLQLLIVLRVIQAIAIASVSVICRALLRDVAQGQELMRKMTVNQSLLGLSLALGPFVGGVIVDIASWRVVFGLQASYAAMMFGGTWLLRETAPACDQQKISLAGILGNFKTFLQHRLYTFALCIGSLCFSGMFGFVSLSSHIIINTLRMSPSLYGLCMPLLSFGYVGGAFILNQFLKRDSQSGATQGPSRVHYLRLGGWIVLTGSVLFCLSAALTEVLAVSALTIGLVLASLVVAFFGTGLILPIVIVLCLEPFAAQAGAAASFYTLVFFITGGVSAMVLSAIYAGSIVVVSIFMLMCTALTVMMIQALWRWHNRIAE